MAVEIERKFLINGIDWKKDVRPSFYRQGYIFAEKKGVVRVRTIDQKGYLTIKSAPVGLKRQEYEFEIPLADANAMLDNLCENYIVEKKRYKIKFADHTWDIDEFTGHNEGLYLAEIELSDENETFEKPSWIGDEVSQNPKYHNSNLSKKPFTKW
ncbi:MAG TPA: CYTH domain-containing protein [Caldithrix sp.]|nr:CYTH domain-containing protein [Calditrichaceae bacterium]HEM49188.1 CYTH domain-containing protein [Caldithrix sp.]